MENKIEETVKKLIKSEMLTFKILEKGLREQLKVGTRHNKKQLRRANALRKKYKETTGRYGFDFVHEDGNKYYFGSRHYQPTGKISEDLRHLYLARAFILGVPYKVVENNSKTTGTISVIEVISFIDAIMKPKYTYWYNKVTPETVWDYLTSRFDETNKVKAIEKWLTAT